MAGPTTRDELVQISRAVPKDIVGIASVGGCLVAVIGVVSLIVSGIAAVGGQPALVDWRIAATFLVFGAASACWAGLILGRRLYRQAAAAGFTPEQIREIEDEAERLNEKED